MQCFKALNLTRSLYLLPPCRRLLFRDASTTLYIGGLSSDTNETVMKDAFEQHGGIKEVKVICYRRSGQSRGFGFIKFSLESEATTALQKMDGQMLDGRKIRVRYARGLINWRRNDCKFAGVEGLRACCLVKAVVEDRQWPYIKTKIPNPIQCPNAENSYEFQESLVETLYGLSVWDRL